MQRSLARAGPILSGHTNLEDKGRGVMIYYVKPAYHGRIAYITVPFTYQCIELGSSLVF